MSEYGDAPQSFNLNEPYNISLLDELFSIPCEHFENCRRFDLEETIFFSGNVARNDSIIEETKEELETSGHNMIDKADNKCFKGWLQPHTKKVIILSNPNRYFAYQLLSSEEGLHVKIPVCIMNTCRRTKEFVFNMDSAEHVIALSERGVSENRILTNIQKVIHIAEVVKRVAAHNNIVLQNVGEPAVTRYLKMPDKNKEQERNHRSNSNWYDALGVHNARKYVRCARKVVMTNLLPLFYEIYKHHGQPKSISLNNLDKAGSYALQSDSNAVAVLQKYIKLLQTKKNTKFPTFLKTSSSGVTKTQTKYEKARKFLDYFKEAMLELTGAYEENHLQNLRLNSKYDHLNTELEKYRSFKE